MQFLLQKKKIIIAIAIVVILIITFIFSITKEENKVLEENLAIDNVVIKEEEKSEIVMFKVDIKGEVKNPGVYDASITNRVIDIINLAGGLKDSADTSLINLSKKVIDEMVIIIYSKNFIEELKSKTEKEIIKVKELKNNSLIKDVVDNVVDTINSDDENSTINYPISINNGTLKELITIPGIGEAKAQSIIDYREANGPFMDIKDITNVSGIGDSTLAKIKDYITI